jgi:hypothetical protein
MKIAYHSLDGSTISWCRRCYDEGADILLYIPTRESNRIGENIVPKTESKEEWMEWGNESPDTIYFFDASGSGELGDELKKEGKIVVGSGKFMDKLESDRKFGEELAKKVGYLMSSSKELYFYICCISVLVKEP